MTKSMIMKWNIIYKIERYFYEIQTPSSLQIKYKVISMSFQLPTVPPEWVGNEPSMEMLEIFTNIHYLSIFKDEPDLRNVVIESIQFAETQKRIKNKHYYLYSQLLTSINEPLTNKLLQKAIDENKCKLREYGQPINNSDIIYFRFHTTRFLHLIKIINLYYIHTCITSLHEKLPPLEDIQSFVLPPTPTIIAPPPPILQRSEPTINNTQFILPIVPDTHIDNAPSLEQLSNFINDHHELIPENDIMEMISDYMQYANENGHYYIYGYCDISITEPLTNNLLQKVIDNDIQLNIKKDGNPVTAMDAINVYHHKNNFYNLLEIINRYYIFNSISAKNKQ